MIKKGLIFLIFLMIFQVFAITYKNLNLFFFLNEKPILLNKNDMLTLRFSSLDARQHGAATSIFFKHCFLYYT